MNVALVWFRNDLRLSDNPALTAAVATGLPVIPVFIWAPDEEGDWAPGGASRWWKHHALAALDEALQGQGGRLVFRAGNSQKELEGLIAETGATHVFWNRRYEPRARARDTVIKESLTTQGLAVRSFNGALLNEPHTVQTLAGGPFQVFTPFWKSCLSKGGIADELPAPRKMAFPEQWPTSVSLDSLALLPTTPWDTGFKTTWKPGEAGAKRALNGFLDKTVNGYAESRDFPAEPGTSRLSPYLHHGETSPRQIWHAVHRATSNAGQLSLGRGAEVFLREVGWREFAYHLLVHFPETTHRPLRENFERFPWQEEPTLLRAWQRGQTGYPIVDAGMRELWHTGWMHNRVRMITASFLVKHLLIPWQPGSRWFWDTLVDADLASNTLGWQWTAGCGADAAPYFRIFNPITQCEKFDPTGAYVRRWIPEIARLPNKFLSSPWTAPASVLTQAGVELGKNYPQPMVDHFTARDRALEAFQSLKAGL